MSKNALQNSFISFVKEMILFIIKQDLCVIPIKI